MICVSGGSKSRLAKAAGAEPAGHRSDDKLHAVVARSTFPSQNVQSTTCLRHFWRFGCWKSARRCGAKHILKSKVLKTGGLGPLLEVEMSKSARRCSAKHISKSKVLKTGGLGPLLEVAMSKLLWREAHFEVKMYKTLGVRTTFGSSDVEKVHVVLARSTFPSQNVQNTTCLRHFWRFGCWKSARRCGVKHISKSKVLKTDGLGPLLVVQMPLRFNTLHYRTLQYTTLQYTTLHYITRQYTPLHSITLHHTTLHWMTLQHR